MIGNWTGRLAILATASGLALAGCASRTSPTATADGASASNTAAVDCHAAAEAPMSGPATVPQPGDSARSGRLDPAAQAIGALGRGRFKTSYTGLALDPDHGALVVYRKPEPEFDVAARKTAGDVRVDFCDTTRSKAELDPVAERIVSENSQGQHGFMVYAASVTLEGYLEVGADKPDIARPYLKNTYGPAVSEVVQGKPSANQ